MIMGWGDLVDKWCAAGVGAEAAAKMADAWELAHRQIDEHEEYLITQRLKRDASNAAPADPLASPPPDRS